MAVLCLVVKVCNLTSPICNFAQDFSARLRRLAVERQERQMKDKIRPTVALDPETYRRLRQLGLDTGKSNQDMIAAAIREYLARWEAA